MGPKCFVTASFYQMYLSGGCQSLTEQWSRGADGFTTSSGGSGLESLLSSNSSGCAKTGQLGKIPFRPDNTVPNMINVPVYHVPILKRYPKLLTTKDSEDSSRKPCTTSRVVLDPDCLTC